jgi:hypothetical protein
MRSPYHLRVVEVRNDTGQLQTLTIETTADQHLGAATTFTGQLRPGEVKVLYLYHGFEYAFAVLDERGHKEVTSGEFQVDRNIGLVFSGDSLFADAGLVVELGDPTVTFADSLQELDPFGLRSGEPIEPDTTNVRDRSGREGAERGVQRR